MGSGALAGSGVDTGGRSCHVGSIRLVLLEQPTLAGTGTTTRGCRENYTTILTICYTAFPHRISSLLVIFL